MGNSTRLPARKLLLIVDAPGPAEFIAPVIPLLKKSLPAGRQVRIQLVTVKESPTNILAGFKPTRCDEVNSAEAIYKKIAPDILLVATSSLVTGPYVTERFTELAHTAGAKIICFQDIWANHRWPTNFRKMKYWDSILTIDEMAENLLLQDEYKGQIYITGSPAFDRFRDVNVVKERAKLRKKYKIPEKSLVILYSGAATPAGWKVDETTFKFLAKAVALIQKDLPDSVFIAHQHPRDEKPGRYQALAPNLKFFDADRIQLAEEILPMVDIVIGMYATNLIHACYLRIPGISILLPNAGGKRLKENLSLSDFPTNAIGATTGIYKEDVGALKKAIENLTTDPLERSTSEAIQKKFFSFGKKTATEMAAEAIKKELQ